MNQLEQVLLFLPAVLRPLVRKVAFAQLRQIPPEKMEEYNADFDLWLQAIAAHNTVVILWLYEKYHIPAGGVIERLTARMVGMP